jgi:hypothetical protein
MVSPLWKTMKTQTAAKAKAPPSFRQLCLIVREVITRHPTDGEADLKEAIKLRCLQLGYRYNNQQIPRAMDAVERAMHRYFLTPAQIAALRPPPRRSEMTQQIDPPWRTITRGPPTWTSTKQLLDRLTSSPSAPPTSAPGATTSKKRSTS